MGGERNGVSSVNKNKTKSFSSTWHKAITRNSKWPDKVGKLICLMLRHLSIQCVVTLPCILYGIFLGLNEEALNDFI